MAVPGVLTPSGEFVPTAGPAVGTIPAPGQVVGGGTPGVILVTDVQPQYDSRGRLMRDRRLRPRSPSRERYRDRDYDDRPPPPPYAGGNVTHAGKIDNRSNKFSYRPQYKGSINIGGRGRSKSKDKKKKDGSSSRSGSRSSRSRSRSRSGSRSRRGSSRGKKGGSRRRSSGKKSSSSGSGRKHRKSSSSSSGSKKTKKTTAAPAAAAAAAAPASSTGDSIGDIIVTPGYRVPYWRRFGWPRRRFYRRHRRHPYFYLGEALVGTQHTPSIHSDRMFKVIRDKYLEYRKSDNRPRAFIKALDAVKQEYTDIANPTESFSVHSQLLKALKTGDKLTLTFEYGKNKVKLHGRVHPLLSQDHVQAVFVPSSKASPILLNNDDNISFKLADFSHDDIFVNNNVSSKLTHLPISLYNEREHALYRKYHIPTPHAVLDIVPSGSKSAPFRLNALSIFLDMRPPKVSRTHVAIPGYPALERSVDFAQTSAVSSYVQDSPKIAAALHESISAKVAPATLISKSQSFVPDPDEYVHLGHLTGTVVSYAVVKLVTAAKSFHALDDPKFLRKQLSVDAIGKKAVEHITKLSNAMVHVDDATGVDNFPTIRQLLTHTSGLPEGIHITCEDVMNMYESATATIKDPVKLNKPLPAPSSGVLSPTSDPYMVAEQGFVDSLAMLTPSANPGNSGFGQWANSTEAALVAMFLRRFVSLAKTAEEIITEVFLNINRAINFVWNVTRDGNDSIITLGPGNPYSLVECASIDRAGFVAYINQMAGELASVNKSTSPLAIMLANPLKTRGDIESHYMGWHTSNDTPLQIIYCGNTSAVQSVLAFFIPALDFWGVAIADATTAAEPVAWHGALLDAMIEGVEAVKEIPEIPLSFADRSSGTLANAPYVPPTEYASISLPETTTYISPFMDPTATYFPVLTLDLFEDDNQLILATISNPASKGKPLSQFFMAYDLRNKAYVVVREDGTLGGVVSITPEAIYLPLQGIFYEASKHAALIKPYVDAVSGLSSKNSIDTRTDAATEELLRQIKRPVAPIKLLRTSSTAASSSSSLEPQRIESGFGWGLAAGGLAGLAAGGLLASRPVYVAPAPAYAYPYGYPYGYRRGYYRRPIIVADSIADASIGVVYVEPAPVYDEFGNVIVVQPTFGYGWGGYYGGPFLGGGRYLGWRGPRRPYGGHHHHRGHRGGGGGRRGGRR